MLLIFSVPCFSGEIYSKIPDEIDANKKYVFYLHGLIVEGDNPRPIHKKYGAYEFQKIKEALAENSSFDVIAHHRPANTEVREYTNKLVSWVKELLNSGVRPSNITLIGFSRGGEIAAYASTNLRENNINTVLLGSCWPGSVQNKSSIVFGGHFLSIFETSDVALSCEKLAKRSPQLLSFKEVSISTGGEHGAFFSPNNEWVIPVKEWVQSKN